MADPIDYDKMQRAFEAALKSRGGSGGFSGGGGAPSASGSSPEQSKFLNSLATSAGNVTDFGKSIYNSGKEYLGVFRNLSNAGTNFSNDIVKIGVAAADSRLSLNEFSEVIRENGKNFAGLGGSVTRGAEAFSKLSKEFFDSRLTDELKQLGFTSKELNDVLAIQMATQRSTFNDTESGRKASLQAAASLAEEMDRLAKLTGKTREEQAKEAQKRSMDGQVEAKLRLIGIEQGAEAEAKARAAFQQQMAQAEARGMGQLAKEMFATGTITSEEAAAQYALLGRAAEQTGVQMQELSKGNIEAAEAASKEADAANARNQRDPNLLRITTFGEAAGIAGTVLKQNVEVNMALHDAVMAAAKGLKPGLTNSIEDFRKALNIVNEDIRRSQQGRNRQGEQVSGVTRAGVRGGIALEDVRAGAARAVESTVGGPARQLGLAGEKFVSETAPRAADVESNIKKGISPEQASPYATPSEKREAQGGILGSIAGAVNKVATMGVDLLKVERADIPVPGRRTGSLGEVGKLIEDFGQGTLAMLHGKEGVVTEAQMMDLAKGFKAEGVSSAINQLKSSIKTDAEAAPAGIDISNISKQIQTTISSVGGEKISDFSKSLETQSPTVDVGSISQGIDFKSIFQEFKGELVSSMESMKTDLNSKSTNQEFNEDLSLSMKSIMGDLTPNVQETATSTQEDTKKELSNSSFVSQNDASLKDVVNSLDRLNMMMGQLLAQNEDIGMKQIRASKTAGSPNLYDSL